MLRNSNPTTAIMNLNGTRNKETGKDRLKKTQFKHEKV